MRRGAFRRGGVVVHRWAGLAMAGFLLVAGLTGSVLAWFDELECLVNPGLMLAEPATPGAPLLDPLSLHASALKQLPPGAAIPWIPLNVEAGRTLRMSVTGGDAARPLPFDEVFVDPYTGRVQGRRQWGDLAEGRPNLLTFVYRLHYSLALGAAGTTLLGIVALVWTLDCFVGAWLTMPASRTRWLARWQPAWRMRLGAGRFKLIFDLHRAGGLWPWALLFVLAWSSVAFNLSAVYAPVTRALLGQQAVQPGFGHLAALTAPRPEPALAPAEALAAARQLAARQAAARGFQVLREDWLGYEAERGIYIYMVTSDRDIRERYGGNTRLAIDADTGAFKGLYLPTGEAAGDTVTSWLTTLHMAAMWGWPLKVIVTAGGLAVAALSVTGALIWWRKRRSRKAHVQVRVPG
jgi:uncharacterized iron-regulated membrane protein